jgi:hypothetical protein
MMNVCFPSGIFVIVTVPILSATKVFLCSFQRTVELARGRWPDLIVALKMFCDCDEMSMHSSIPVITSLMSKSIE